MEQKNLELENLIKEQEEKERLIEQLKELKECYDELIKLKDIRITQYKEFVLELKKLLVGPQYSEIRYIIDKFVS